MMAPILTPGSMTGHRYRALANKCFMAADAMADPESKLAQLVLAQRWLRLADEIDQASPVRRDADKVLTRRSSSAA